MSAPVTVLIVAFDLDADLLNKHVHLSVRLNHETTKLKVPKRHGIIFWAVLTLCAQ